MDTQLDIHVDYGHLLGYGLLTPIWIWFMDTYIWIQFMETYLDMVYGQLLGYGLWTPTWIWFMDNYLDMVYGYLLGYGLAQSSSDTPSPSSSVEFKIL